MSDLIYVRGGSTQHVIGAKINGLLGVRERRHACGSVRGSGGARVSSASATHGIRSAETASSHVCARDRIGGNQCVRVQLYCVGIGATVG